MGLIDYLLPPPVKQTNSNQIRVYSILHNILILKSVCFGWNADMPLFHTFKLKLLCRRKQPHLKVRSNQRVDNMMNQKTNKKMHNKSETGYVQLPGE